MNARIRSPREVVEDYNFSVWNTRDLDLADELLGDQVIRHDVGESRTLTHTEAVQRVADTWTLFSELRFELILLIEGNDSEHVTIAYEAHMTLTDGKSLVIGSMEIFRVVGGRIVEVYNCGHKEGVWQ
ncbi:MAG TPA: ester cyclase [Gordonia sp. (in: high G+C Gram-positive bacteria)]|uniref:nuclear transport factor 2 family protein n=1 Tax=unclassified Gordonia (in: high G+C Gram-positive bacteria) TaxID=2657482 RepID=UPI000FA1370A|nr:MULTISPECIES: nuclear transport factor 2 family protein [unclassified Gordonia (in: high G+C Gram-positive bacteria)]RUP38624.1 MAG: nuclear transport factor 2 family protein [Gordonia sp. (in: high G+C Gram-positive bacteria)]HNP56234.1 ester cyclase [Gordonia sp. (in: high G+C Gram-positive bacteria)]HRC51727.1 ester cyclase [Gordonia sp. (in: high G+C Gram-positive bacteria)]